MNLPDISAYFTSKQERKRKSSKIDLLRNTKTQQKRDRNYHKQKYNQHQRKSNQKPRIHSKLLIQRYDLKEIENRLWIDPNYLNLVPYSINSVHYKINIKLRRCSVCRQQKRFTTLIDCDACHSYITHKSGIQFGYYIYEGFYYTYEGYHKQKYDPLEDYFCPDCVELYNICTNRSSGLCHWRGCTTCQYGYLWKFSKVKDYDQCDQCKNIFCSDKNNICGWSYPQKAKQKYYYLNRKIISPIQPSAGRYTKCWNCLYKEEEYQVNTILKLIEHEFDDLFPNDIIGVIFEFAIGIYTQCCNCNQSFSVNNITQFKMGMDSKGKRFKYYFIDQQ